MFKLFICFFVFGLAVNAAPDMCKGPPPPVDMRQCCKLPELMTDSIVQQCSAFMPPPPPMGAAGMPQPDPEAELKAASCFGQCVLNVTGVVTGATALNTAGLEAAIAKMVPNDDAYGKVLNNSLITCDPQVKDTMPKQLAPGSKCSPYSVLLIACNMYQNIINCPDKYWTSNKQCEDGKTYMQKCPPPQPPKQ